MHEQARTYSNPTANEILRRLLDERGVEWHRGKLAMLDDEYTQWWVSDRMEGFVAYECDYPLNTLIVRGITPAQAIAATLGQAVRHPKPHEKWTTVLLPEIAWSWDDSWPDYLSVAHDTHGEWRVYVPEARLLEAMDAAREAGRQADMAERVAADRKGLCDSLRETNDDLRRIIDEMRSATLGTGTCKRVMDSIDPFTMWVCDHCGHPLDTSENFCGGCGRKVVD